VFGPIGDDFGGLKTAWSNSEVTVAVTRSEGSGPNAIFPTKVAVEWYVSLELL